MGLKVLVKDNVLKHYYKEATRGYLNYYKKVIAYNPEILKVRRERERVWLQKWRKYDRHLSPLAYRVFSYYIGEDLNIMPMELCVNVVERVLTPSSFSDYYSDKNSLGKIVPKEYFPLVFLRNIRGVFYDGDYSVLHSIDVDEWIDGIPLEKIILKPTRLDSGRGIDVFCKSSGGFFNERKDRLNKQYLDAYYRQDYLVQECLRQSDFTAQFNPSSVNTIRIATYRDLQGNVHPLKAVLRIGVQGAVVDNSHFGGVACGIGTEGKLGEYVCDIYGNRQRVFNGIDFEKSNLVLPNYQEVQQFAVAVSQNVFHHDLVALDIALDSNAKPVLLEINVDGFAGWIFQLLSGTIFGEYTDDVMEYCHKQIMYLEPSISIAVKKYTNIQ